MPKMMLRSVCTGTMGFTLLPGAEPRLILSVALALRQFCAARQSCFPLLLFASLSISPQVIFVAP